MALPGFPLEIIRNLLARTAMIRAVNNIAVPRIRHFGKRGFDGFVKRHKTDHSETQQNSRCNAKSN